MNVLSKIVCIPFPRDQYIRRITDKSMVCVHHTVSGRGVKGDINWWESDPLRIATCIIIHHNGTPYQLFSSRYWAHHLGVKSEVFHKYRLPPINRALNMSCIGVELDSWGPLMQGFNGNYYPIRKNPFTSKMEPNMFLRPIPKENINFYPGAFRGYTAYERYTDEQLQTLRELLIFWFHRYNIPLDYHFTMWDVSKAALSGEPGVWSHVSYRPDKSDCHPQAELVKMLQSLNAA